MHRQTSTASFSIDQGRRGAPDGGPLGLGSAGADSRAPCWGRVGLHFDGPSTSGGPLGGDGTARVVPTGSGRTGIAHGRHLSRAVRRIGEPGRGHRADPAGRAAAVATTPRRGRSSPPGRTGASVPGHDGTCWRATAVAASRSPVVGQGAQGPPPRRHGRAGPGIADPRHPHRTHDRDRHARRQERDAAPRFSPADAARISVLPGPGRSLVAPSEPRRREPSSSLPPPSTGPPHATAVSSSRFMTRPRSCPGPAPRSCRLRCGMTVPESWMRKIRSSSATSRPVMTRPRSACSRGTHLCRRGPCAELVHVGALAAACAGDGQQADALGDRPGADHPVAPVAASCPERCWRCGPIGCTSVSEKRMPWPPSETTRIWSSSEVGSTRTNSSPSRRLMAINLS